MARNRRETLFIDSGDSGFQMEHARLFSFRLDSLFNRILKATPPGHDDHERIKV